MISMLVLTTALLGTYGDEGTREEKFAGVLLAQNDVQFSDEAQDPNKKPVKVDSVASLKVKRVLWITLPLVFMVGGGAIGGLSFWGLTALLVATPNLLTVFFQFLGIVLLGLFVGVGAVFVVGGLITFIVGLVRASEIGDELKGREEDAQRLQTGSLPIAPTPALLVARF